MEIKWTVNREPKSARKVGSSDVEERKILLHSGTVNLNLKKYIIQKVGNMW